jgi:hypothetical protein
LAAFDHVTILFSFVYALALTHVLSRLAGLLSARARVRFSWLPVLWMAIAVLLVFGNWLSLWDGRALQTWTLYSISLQFLLAVTLYFVCAMAAPEFSVEGPIDMQALYAQTRVPLFWLLLGLCLVGVLANLSLSEINPQIFAGQNILTLVFAAAAALPLAVRKGWAEWTGAIICLLLSCAFLGLFEGALR